jgi:23S rRNA (guanosine2251-2'-O)-methyltransferase
MLTRCPYPDCLVVSEIETADKIKSSVSNTVCPQCQRLGRVKSLEIVNSLGKRVRQNSQTQIFNSLPVQDEHFQVVLEDIRSLWNVGSVFRTADAVGVSMLYLCGITGCPPRREITKTALGAEENVPWQYFVHTLDIIPALIASGVTIIGLERNHQSVGLTGLLREKKINKPLCLVVGNENDGLSPETIHYCHHLSSLPMKGKKESLNAAVAFAVAAYFINEFR